MKYSVQIEKIPVLLYPLFEFSVALITHRIDSTQIPNPYHSAVACDRVVSSQCLY